ncbi:MAG TPA: MFS transporter [Ktedonobacteraceae bacterium]
MLLHPHFKRSPFHVPAAFHPLTEKNFAALWVGAFVSNLGFWIQNVAQGWQVLQLTNSALLLGLVAFIGTIPSLLFSLFGGMIADKFDRRRLLIMVNSIYICTALLLGILTSLGTIKVWHIITVALINGLFSAISFPAWQIFVADLIRDDDLKQGIALNSMQFNLSRVIGPALGGLSIGIFGIAGSYYLNSLSYVGVILPLILMHPEQKRARVQETQRVADNLMQGLLYLKDHPVLVILLGLQLMIAFFVMPYTTLLPIFAADIFRTGPAGLGVMNAVAGIGALLGAVLLVLLMERLRRPVQALFLLCLLGGLASVIFAVVPDQLLSLPLLIALGASTVMATTFTNTAIQSATPADLRARVVSIWITITFGLAPFGSLVAGAVAQSTGAQPTIMLGGAICVIVAGALAFFARKMTRPAL